eukprot:Selendium_serpulae@DN1849_c0_g1_i1.p1
MMARDARDSDLQSIELQFCPECANLMYPFENVDEKKLVLCCRSCNYGMEADPSDPNSFCTDRQNFNFRSEEDVNSYIVKGLVDDPTLPRMYHWECQECKKRGAVFFQLPERVKSDAMTLVFVCLDRQCTFYQMLGKESIESHIAREELPAAAVKKPDFEDDPDMPLQTGGPPDEEDDDAGDFLFEEAVRVKPNPDDDDDDDEPPLTQTATAPDGRMEPDAALRLDAADEQLFGGPVIKPGPDDDDDEPRGAPGWPPPVAQPAAHEDGAETQSAVADTQPAAMDYDGSAQLGAVVVVHRC